MLCIFSGMHGFIRKTILNIFSKMTHFLQKKVKNPIGFKSGHRLGHSNISRLKSNRTIALASGKSQSGTAQTLQPSQAREVSLKEWNNKHPCSNLCKPGAFHTQVDTRNTEAHKENITFLKKIRLTYYLLMRDTDSQF